MSTSGYSTPSRKTPSVSHSAISVASTTHPVPYVSDNFLGKINAATFGPGRTYCTYAYVALVFVIIGFVSGVTILGLFLSGYFFEARVEWGIAVCFVVFCVALAIMIYFYTKARVKSTQQRRTIKFKPKGDHSVSVSVINVGFENDQQPQEELKSGTVTEKAVLQVEPPQQKQQRYRKSGDRPRRPRSTSSQHSGDSSLDGSMGRISTNPGHGSAV